MDVALEVFIFHGSMIFDESKVLTIGGVSSSYIIFVLRKYY